MISPSKFLGLLIFSSRCEDITKNFSFSSFRSSKTLEASIFGINWWSTSNMGLPVLIMRSAGRPSRNKYSLAISLYVRFTSATWSTIFLLVSSGTRWSKQRLPASIWKTGIFLFLAGIAQRQEFVSPKTRKASGLSFSKSGSILIRILPTVSVAFFPAAFKKWSGLRMPRSSKNISFSS